ncbi:MAG TPA: GGDEF domain-containing protein [Symbiobacteriaceae bacterium]|nr:GGDEF domain-containing protein [Symbiobacteriaceae bacterium]
MVGRSSDPAGFAGITSLVRDGCDGIMSDVADHLPAMERFFAHTRWVTLAPPVLLYLRLGPAALIPALVIAGAIASLNLLVYGILRRGQDRLESWWIWIRFAELGIVGLCATLAHQWLGAQEASTVLGVPILYTSLVGGLRPAMFALAGAMLQMLVSAVYLHSVDPALWQWSTLLRENATFAGFFTYIAFTGILLSGLVRRARRTADTDPLTQLFNRRHFTGRLTRALRRRVGNEDPVGIILIDLDHFKRINDQFGHPGGDRVLQAVAATLCAHAGPALVARLGGEEFAVLVRGYPEAVLALAESLRVRLRTVDMSAGAGHPFRVTISAGVAVGEPGCTDAHLLLQRADRALYRAKAAGRDRVVAWSPELGEESSFSPVPEQTANLWQWLRAGSRGIGWPETQGWTSLELGKFYVRWAVTPIAFLISTDLWVSLEIVALVVINNLLTYAWVRRGSRGSLVRGMTLRIVDLAIIGLAATLIHTLNGNTIFNGTYAVEIVPATALGGWLGFGLTAGISLLLVLYNCVLQNYSPIMMGGLMLVSVLAFLFYAQLVMLLVGMEVWQSRQEAMVDGLTGTATRLAFQDRLRQSAAAAAGNLCAIVATDIDDFKQVNDRWGHLTGDLVLRRVAQVMLAQARPDETVGRFGGEEFVFSTPAGAFRARQWVTAVQHELMAHPTRADTGGSAGGEQLPVTLSFGLTCLLPGESVGVALERVDRVLYQAKIDGKNRLVEANPPQYNVEVRR